MFVGLWLAVLFYFGPFGFLLLLIVVFRFARFGWIVLLADFDCFGLFCLGLSGCDDGF